MKVKFTTNIDERLLKEIKIKAIEENRNVNEIIEEQLEKYLEEGNDMKKIIGKMFSVTSAWVEQNDVEVFDYLRDMLAEFAEDESNTTTWADVQSFDNGEWEVQYYFDESEDGDVVISIIAGETSQDIANQPDWTNVLVGWKEFQEYWPVDAYLKVITEGEDYGL